MNKRLLHAPDLQTRQEYGIVNGKKTLLRIVRSSKTLGLEEVEEITQPPAAAAKTGASGRKGE